MSSDFATMERRALAAESANGALVASNKMWLDEIKHNRARIAQLEQLMVAVRAMIHAEELTTFSRLIGVSAILNSIDGLSEKDRDALAKLTDMAGSSQ